jgi:FAD/FMN-containing dehydrogenase
VTADFHAALADLLLPEQILAGSAAAPYHHEQRGRYASAPVPVLLPDSTAQVAAIVRLCAAHGVGVVPQGGNTGLVGGSVATAARQIILNLARMNRIRDLDPANFTLTAEAGCTLAAIKAAAAGVGRLFPLGLAVAAECQIGGNIASNAGGVNVLRYGMTRDLVLGLEAVLPDGTVLSELTRLRKNNVGLDLKQLLIGTEGTFGIITAAVLKLWPQPRSTATLWLGFATLDAAMRAFVQVREEAGETLSAFELMSAASVTLVERFRPQLPPPVRAAWGALVSLESARAGDDLAALARQLAAMPNVTSAATAPDAATAEAFWAIRRALPWVQREAGGSIKHDIAVPLSAIAAFVAEADAAVTQLVPGAQPVTFGHAGDGNLHYNILQPEQADRAAFLARSAEVNAAVHAIVRRYDGSISAEHGIGLAKKAALRQSVAAESLVLRRQLKQAIDPQGMMNPGKGMPDDDA